VGTVITFYSYKGGTGRSMLLANTAWLLAANGERVLVIDWDLEAPGLHRYFRPFLVDPDMSETEGLIDVLWVQATSALARTASDAQQSPRVPALADAELADVDLEDYISPLKWDFPGHGGIDFLGAGCQGGTYSERVNTFDWKRFYQLGGGRWLDRLRASLATQYGFVLIDSRTGVSDTSGICTIQMPDTLVACLTLNRQSIEGVASILDSVRAWRAGAEPGRERSEPRRSIALYPVVTRIENSEKRKLQLGRLRARDVLGEFLAPDDKREARRYWDEMEVTYWPYYAYEEVLAAFGDTAGAAGSAKSLLSEMEAVGRRLTGRPDLQMPEIPEAAREKVLAEYALGMLGPDQDPARTVAEARGPGGDDTEFLRGIYAKERRWRLGGYHYRDLLSGRELKLLTPEDRSKFGRQMSFYHENSELFPAYQQKAQTLWIFALIALLASLVAAGLRRWALRFWATLTPLGFLLVFGLIYSVPPVLVATLLLRAFLLHRSPLKPYGVRFWDVVKLILLGPFTVIRDFEERRRTVSTGP